MTQSINPTPLLIVLFCAEYMPVLPNHRGFNRHLLWPSSWSTGTSIMANSKSFSISLLLMLLLLPASVLQAQTALDAERIVQRHLDAHNAHNLEAILGNFSEFVDFRILSSAEGGDVKKILNREDLQRQFETALTVNPNSHFRVLSKISTPDTVIINEEVTGLPGGKNSSGITLYKVESGKISALWMLDSET